MIIELDTVRGVTAYLKPLKRKDGKESDVYQLKTDAESIRTGTTNQGALFIQPTGCNAITEGKPIDGSEFIAVKIILSEKFGYVIRIKE